MARARPGEPRHGRARDDGETLVEIVIAVVIIGIAVGALVSALATSANAGIAQRDGAVADAALRNMAEAAKAAARDCTKGKLLDVVIDVPDGWVGATEPVAVTCPAASELRPLHLIVSGPGGHTSTLDVILRSP